MPRVWPTPESTLTNQSEYHAVYLTDLNVATGSLGQGLSCAAGMAYTGKYFDKSE